MRTSDKIETELIADVSAGILSPGERIDEVALATRFQCSRTPIREAVAGLVAKGVLQSQTRQGIYVRTYSREELGEMLEAMQELETICARLVSQRLTLLSRSELEYAQKQCRSAAEAGDFPAYLRANEAFHQVIYKATRNRFISEIASEFRQRTGPFRAKKFASAQDLLDSADSHDRLLDSIFSEDTKIATEEMRIQMTRSYMEALAANL